MLEACRVQNYPFKPDQEVALCDWQVYLQKTALKILEQQSPQRSVLPLPAFCANACCGRLLEIRGRLYELLTHCIPPDVIIKVIRGCACRAMSSLVLRASLLS